MLASSAWTAALLIRVCPTPPPEGVDTPSKRMKDKCHIPLGFVFTINKDRRNNAVWELLSADRKDEAIPKHTATKLFRRRTGLPCVAAQLRQECHFFDAKGCDVYLFSISITQRQCEQMESRIGCLPGDRPKFFDQKKFAALVKGNKFRKDQMEALRRHGLVLAFGPHGKVPAL